MENPKRPTVVLGKANRFPTVFSMDNFPRPPFPEQQQPVPGTTNKMNPRSNHGEDSYKGSARLYDKKVLITGGNSGIGWAVALAFAREGADLLVSYLDEHEDAAETRRLVVAAGRTCVLMPSDIGMAAHCRALVDAAVQAFGRIDGCAPIPHRRSRPAR